VILAWILGISALIAALVLYIRTLDTEAVQVFSGALTSGLILMIFFSIRELIVEYFQVLK
jgi:hypothetical protein